jgi:DNA-binding transcriptional LysR family regulator
MRDLRRMMLLCDLAELGTVTAVAERRNITSSAVSQQLRVLEAEAGAILLRRDGRTLGLTRSGQVLVEHVRRVLSAVDEAMSAVAATNDRSSGQLMVGAFDSAVSLLVVPLVQRVGTRLPDVDVQVRQHSSQDALRLLRQGELDIAITCTYDFRGHESVSGLSRQVLLAEPLVLVAPGRLHRRLRTQGLVALANEPWVTGAIDSPLAAATQLIGEQAGFEPQVSHRLAGEQNICDLAATEVASAIVPRYSVPRLLRGLVVDDVVAGSRSFNVLVREGRLRDPTITAVLRELQEIAREVEAAATGVAHLVVAS